MLNIGIIGYKNHAEKVKKILEKKHKIKYIFHPKKKINLANFTNNIKDLLNLNCIFIVSPSKSHFYYLDFLKKNKFKGYIFCEKPPVTNLNDLKKLSKFKNNKIYFNFNLRHSYINKYFKYNNLGNLLSLNIFDSKPLIYKHGLKKNWRMHVKDTLITNNLVHYLDLILFKYQVEINNIKLLTNKINNKFKIVDNIVTLFKIKKVVFNINISYASGIEKLYLFYFTNGKIEINDKYIKIYYPARVIDKNKNFLKPKLKKIVKIKNIFDDSNIQSINYFLNAAKKKINFSQKEIDTSLKTNKLILDLSKKI